MHIYIHTHILYIYRDQEKWLVCAALDAAQIQIYKYIHTYIRIHILYTYSDQGKWLVSAALDAAQSKIALRLAMDLSFQESGDDEAKALYVRALKAQRRARYGFHYAMF